MSDRAELEQYREQKIYWHKRALKAEAELEQCKAEIKVLEKLINDWRGTCVTEQTVGMEWKERAEKAEAEVKQAKAKNENLDFRVKENAHFFFSMNERRLKERRHRKWALKQARWSMRARRTAQKIWNRMEKAEAENIELQAVFDLQETRTKKAEKMWQQATGKRHILPDLGVLLNWLMGEVKQCKQKVQYFMACEAQDEIDKQRRHRKWALRKAKTYLNYYVLEIDD